MSSVLDSVEASKGIIDQVEVKENDSKVTDSLSNDKPTVQVLTKRHRDRQ